MASTDKKTQTSSKSRPAVKGDARHIIRENGHWAVKGEGRSDVKATFPTQSDAISAALEMAKNSEIIVHSRNGRVKNTISNSPADLRMLGVWKSIHDAQSGKRKR